MAPPQPEAAGGPAMTYYGYRRYRRSRMTPRQMMAAAGAGVVLAGIVSNAHAASTAAHHAAAPAGAAVKAISYARHQIGCPYVYGGTGPCSAGFDCSGLMMQAWAAAGVTIPRTSEEQWAGLPHVSHLEPGDLVLGQVIDAPQTGEDVQIVSLATFGAQAGGIVGYAQPWSS
jgi:hypothetical protein